MKKVKGSHRYVIKKCADEVGKKQEQIIKSVKKRALKWKSILRRMEELK